MSYQIDLHIDATELEEAENGLDSTFSSLEAALEKIDSVANKNGQEINTGGIREDLSKVKELPKVPDSPESAKILLASVNHLVRSTQELSQTLTNAGIRGTKAESVQIGKDYNKLEKSLINLERKILGRVDNPKEYNKQYAAREITYSTSQDKGRLTPKEISAKENYDLNLAKAENLAIGQRFMAEMLALDTDILNKSRDLYRKEQADRQKKLEQETVTKTTNTKTNVNENVQEVDETYSNETKKERTSRVIKEISEQTAQDKQKQAAANQVINIADDSGVNVKSPTNLLGFLKNVGNVISQVSEGVKQSNDERRAKNEAAQSQAVNSIDALVENQPTTVKIPLLPASKQPVDLETEELNENTQKVNKETAQQNGETAQTNKETANISETQAKNRADRVLVSFNGVNPDSEFEAEPMPTGLNWLAKQNFKTAQKRKKNQFIADKNKSIDLTNQSWGYETQEPLKTEPVDARGTTPKTARIFRRGVTNAAELEQIRKESAQRDADTVNASQADYANFRKRIDELNAETASLNQAIIEQQEKTNKQKQEHYDNLAASVNQAKTEGQSIAQEKVAEVQQQSAETIGQKDSIISDVSKQLEESQAKQIKTKEQLDQASNELQQLALQLEEAAKSISDSLKDAANKQDTIDSLLSNAMSLEEDNANDRVAIANQTKLLLQDKQSELDTLVNKVNELEQANQSQGLSETSLNRKIADLNKELLKSKEAILASEKLIEKIQTDHQKELEKAVERAAIDARKALTDRNKPRLEKLSEGLKQRKEEIKQNKETIANKDIEIADSNQKIKSLTEQLNAKVLAALTDDAKTLEQMKALSDQITKLEEEVLDQRSVTARLELELSEEKQALLKSQNQLIENNKAATEMIATLANEKEALALELDASKIRAETAELVADNAILEAGLSEKEATEKEKVSDVKLTALNLELEEYKKKIDQLNKSQTAQEEDNTQVINDLKEKIKVGQETLLKVLADAAEREINLARQSEDKAKASYDSGVEDQKNKIQKQVNELARDVLTAEQKSTQAKVNLANLELQAAKTLGASVVKVSERESITALKNKNELEAKRLQLLEENVKLEQRRLSLEEKGIQILEETNAATDTRYAETLLKLQLEQVDLEKDKIAAQVAEIEAINKKTAAMENLATAESLKAENVKRNLDVKQANQDILVAQTNIKQSEAQEKAELQKQTTTQTILTTLADAIKQLVNDQETDNTNTQTEQVQNVEPPEAPTASLVAATPTETPATKEDVKDVINKEDRLLTPSNIIKGISSLIKDNTGPIKTAAAGGAATGAMGGLAGGMTASIIGSILGGAGGAIGKITEAVTNTTNKGGIKAIAQVGVETVKKVEEEIANQTEFSGGSGKKPPNDKKKATGSTPDDDSKKDETPTPTPPVSSTTPTKKTGKKKDQSAINNAGFQKALNDLLSSLNSSEVGDVNLAAQIQGVLDLVNSLSDNAKLTKESNNSEQLLEEARNKAKQLEIDLNESANRNLDKNNAATQLALDVLNRQIEAAESSMEAEQFKQDLAQQKETKKQQNQTNKNKKKYIKFRYKEDMRTAENPQAAAQLTKDYFSQPIFNDADEAEKLNSLIATELAERQTSERLQRERNTSLKKANKSNNDAKKKDDAIKKDKLNALETNAKANLKLNAVEAKTIGEIEKEAALYLNTVLPGMKNRYNDIANAKLFANEQVTKNVDRLKKDNEDDNTFESNRKSSENKEIKRLAQQHREQKLKAAKGLYTRQLKRATTIDEINKAQDAFLVKVADPMGDVDIDDENYANDKSFDASKRVNRADKTQQSKDNTKSKQEENKVKRDLDSARQAKIRRLKAQYEYEITLTSNTGEVRQVNQKYIDGVSTAYGEEVENQDNTKTRLIAIRKATETALARLEKLETEKGKLLDNQIQNKTKEVNKLKSEQKAELERQAKTNFERKLKFSEQKDDPEYILKSTKEYLSSLPEQPTNIQLDYAQDKALSALDRIKPKKVKEVKADPQIKRDADAKIAMNNRIAKKLFDSKMKEANNTDDLNSAVNKYKSSAVQTEETTYHIQDTYNKALKRLGVSRDKTRKDYVDARTSALEAYRKQKEKEAQELLESQKKEYDRKIKVAKNQEEIDTANENYRSVAPNNLATKDYILDKTIAAQKRIATEEEAFSKQAEREINAFVKQNEAEQSDADRQINRSAKNLYNRKVKYAKSLNEVKAYGVEYLDKLKGSKLDAQDLVADKEAAFLDKEFKQVNKDLKAAGKPVAPTKQENKDRRAFERKNKNLFNNRLDDTNKFEDFESIKQEYLAEVGDTYATQQYADERINARISSIRKELDKQDKKDNNDLNQTNKDIKAEKLTAFNEKVLTLTNEFKRNIQKTTDLKEVDQLAADFLKAIELPNDLKRVSKVTGEVEEVKNVLKDIELAKTEVYKAQNRINKANETKVEEATPIQKVNAAAIRNIVTKALQSGSKEDINAVKNFRVTQKDLYEDETPKDPAIAQRQVDVLNTWIENQLKSFNEALLSQAKEQVKAGNFDDLKAISEEGNLKAQNSLNSSLESKEAETYKDRKNVLSAKLQEAISRPLGVSKAENESEEEFEQRLSYAIAKQKNALENVVQEIQEFRFETLELGQLETTQDKERFSQGGVEDNLLASMANRGRNKIESLNKKLDKDGDGFDGNSNNFFTEFRSAFSTVRESIQQFGMALDGFVEVASRRERELLKLNVLNQGEKGLTEKNTQYARELSQKYGGGDYTYLKTLADFKAANMSSIDKQGNKINAPYTENELNTSVEGITVAAKGLGLNQEQTEGAANAIKQMLSKRVVQSEELRGQLGDRIPGAVSTFAESLGISTAALARRMENSEVGAEEVFKFTSLMKTRYSALASLPTLQKEYDSVKGRIGETATNALQPAAGMATAGLSFINAMLNAIKDNSAVITVGMAPIALLIATQLGAGLKGLALESQLGKTVASSFAGVKNFMPSLGLAGAGLALASTGSVLGMDGVDKTINKLGDSLKALADVISKAVGNFIGSANASTDKQSGVNKVLFEILPLAAIMTPLVSYLRGKNGKDKETEEKENNSVVKSNSKTSNVSNEPGLQENSTSLNNQERKVAAQKPSTVTALQNQTQLQSGQTLLQIPQTKIQSSTTNFKNEVSTEELINKNKQLVLKAEQEILKEREFYRNLNLGKDPKTQLQGSTALQNPTITQTSGTLNTSNSNTTAVVSSKPKSQLIEKTREGIGSVVNKVKDIASNPLVSDFGFSIVGAVAAYALANTKFIADITKVNETWVEELKKVELKIKVPGKTEETANFEGAVKKEGLEGFLTLDSFRNTFEDFEKGLLFEFGINTENSLKSLTVKKLKAITESEGFSDEQRAQAKKVLDDRYSGKGSKTVNGGSFADTSREAALVKVEKDTNDALLKLSQALNPNSKAYTEVIDKSNASMQIATEKRTAYQNAVDTGASYDVQEKLKVEADNAATDQRKAAESLTTLKSNYEITKKGYQAAIASLTEPGSNKEERELAVRIQDKLKTLEDSFAKNYQEIKKKVDPNEKIIEQKENLGIKVEQFEKEKLRKTQQFTRQRANSNVERFSEKDDDRVGLRDARLSTTEATDASLNNKKALEFARTKLSLISQQTQSDKQAAERKEAIKEIATAEQAYMESLKALTEAQLNEQKALEERLLKIYDRSLNAYGDDKTSKKFQSGTALYNSDGKAAKIENYGQLNGVIAFGTVDKAKYALEEFERILPKLKLSATEAKDRMRELKDSFVAASLQFREQKRQNINEREAAEDQQFTKPLTQFSTQFLDQLRSLEVNKRQTERDYNANLDSQKDTQIAINNTVDPTKRAELAQKLQTLEIDLIRKKHANEMAGIEILRLNYQRNQAIFEANIKFAQDKQAARTQYDDTKEDRESKKRQNVTNSKGGELGTEASALESLSTANNRFISTRNAAVAEINSVDSSLNDLVLQRAPNKFQEFQDFKASVAYRGRGDGVNLKVASDEQARISNELVGLRQNGSGTGDDELIALKEAQLALLTTIIKSESDTQTKKIAIEDAQISLQKVRNQTIRDINDTSRSNKQEQFNNDVEDRKNQRNSNLVIKQAEVDLEAEKRKQRQSIQPYDQMLGLNGTSQKNKLADMVDEIAKISLERKNQRAKFDEQNINPSSQELQLQALKDKTFDIKIEAIQKGKVKIMSETFSEMLSTVKSMSGTFSEMLSNINTKLKEAVESFNSKEEIFRGQDLASGGSVDAESGQNQLLQTVNYGYLDKIGALREGTRIEKTLYNAADSDSYETAKLEQAINRQNSESELKLMQLDQMKKALNDFERLGGVENTPEYKALKPEQQAVLKEFEEMALRSGDLNEVMTKLNQTVSVTTASLISKEEKEQIISKKQRVDEIKQSSLANNAKLESLTSQGRIINNKKFVTDYDRATNSQSDDNVVKQFQARAEIIKNEYASTQESSDPRVRARGLQAKDDKLAELNQEFSQLPLYGERFAQTIEDAVASGSKLSEVLSKALTDGNWGSVFGSILSNVAGALQNKFAADATAGLAKMAGDGIRSIVGSFIPKFSEGTIPSLAMGTLASCAIGSIPSLANGSYHGSSAGFPQFPSSISATKKQDPREPHPSHLAVINSKELVLSARQSQEYLEHRKTVMASSNVQNSSTSNNNSSSTVNYNNTSNYQSPKGDTFNRPQSYGIKEKNANDKRFS